MYTLTVSRRKERNHSSKKQGREDRAPPKGAATTQNTDPHPHFRWSCGPLFSIPHFTTRDWRKYPYWISTLSLSLWGTRANPSSINSPTQEKTKKNLSNQDSEARVAKTREKKKNHTSIINHHHHPNKRKKEKKKKRKKKQKISENLRVLDFYFLFSLSSEKPNPRNPAIEASPFSLSQIESELSGFRKVAAKYILWFLHPHSLFAEMMIFPLFPVRSSPISAPESSIWSKCGWNLRFPRSISLSRAVFLVLGADRRRIWRCFGSFSTGSRRTGFWRSPIESMVWLTNLIAYYYYFFWGFFVVLFWFRENWMEFLVNCMSFGCFSCDLVFILLHWCFC